MVRSLIALFFASLMLTACAQKKVDSDVVRATPATPNASKVKETPKAMEGTRYITLLFPKGKSDLGQDNRATLKKFAATIHQENRPIEEIHILAWSDSEYPDKVQGEIPDREVNLASKRAQNIKSYLENDLKEESDVDAYNMARRPNLMSKMLRDDEYEIKEAFETSGTSGSKLPNGEVSYTKAGKAIVIIDYEGDEDNLK